MSVKDKREGDVFCESDLAKVPIDHCGRLVA